MVLLALAAAAQLQASTFFDGTFNNSDWTATKVLDTSNPPASFTAGQAAFDGNPAPFRETTQNFGNNNANGSIWVAHLDSNFIWDPGTQGAIAALNFSFDGKSFSNGVSGGIGYGLVAFQNNTYYLADFTAVSQSQWTNHMAMDLTAGDFFLPGFGTGTPNFSAGGTPIEFGYFTENGITTNTDTTVSGIDNYSLEVVPEPSTWAVAALSLAAIIALRFRRSCRRWL